MTHARGTAILGGATAALLAGAALTAHAADRVTLGVLVPKSPHVTNAGHTRTALCFEASSIAGGPPIQPGGAPEPPTHFDPVPCGAKRRRSALLCLRGTLITIRTPGAAVAGSISTTGQQNRFTATSIDASDTTWKTALALGGIRTSRKRTASLTIAIDHGGGTSTWTAPIRMRGRSC